MSRGPGGKGPKPLTRQRSAWTQVELDVNFRVQMAASGARAIGAWQRQVHDGHLTALLSDDQRDGERHLHLSVSHRTNGARPKPGRSTRPGTS